MQEYGLFYKIQLEGVEVTEYNRKITASANYTIARIMKNCNKH